MSTTPEILYYNRELKEYFAEQVLINTWKWEAITYSYVDVDFDKALVDFAACLRPELVDSALARALEGYKSTTGAKDALRESIRKAAIAKVAYTIAGSEVFGHASSIGPRNYWIEKSSTGLKFKIGLVVQMSPGKLTGTDQRAITEFLNTESLVREVENWLHPGVFDNSEESLEIYDRALKRGRKFAEFESENKTPAFPEEIYVDADAIAEEQTDGIAFRIQPEFLKRTGCRQEDLMALGIYPYCSTVVAEALKEEKPRIEKIMNSNELPTREQLSTLIDSSKI